MKVIKRDGKAVDYNREKIVTAIEKANKEVKPKERIATEEISEITKYIEELDKKRILVEDIQDIIEQKLMDIKKFELAKKYMIYRYTRALIRKSNTTDESILGLIKNKKVSEDGANKSTILASVQRDYIAGEVSKDLTKRILLPEKIAKAHEEGVLYFHDMEYFLQPIFNSSLINIGDMLDNGTVINGKLIESPESFQSACITITQIITEVASNQYGEQSINISYLGKYIKKSYEKIKKEIEKEFINNLSTEIIKNLINLRLKEEIVEGIRIILYQINTLITANGHLPNVTIFLHLEKDNPHIKEIALIIEELLNQTYKGIKNEKGIYITPKFPKLVYVLDENNCLEGGEYDYLTRLAVKCSLEKSYPYYISARKMRENYEKNVFGPMGTKSFLSPWKDENGNYKFEGRFNQGVVTINLPQIGIIANGDEDEFWKLFDERLELCKEALMCRHYALLGTLSSTSPIQWMYGAIARMKPGDKIDELLKNGYSTISLGYVGIYELTKLVKGVSHTSQEGHDFAIKVIKYLKETTDKWRQETGLGFSLYGTLSKEICYSFAEIDKEKFGEIKDITDKGYYTSSYHIGTNEKMDEVKKLSFESEFQKLTLGGAISCIEITDIKDDAKSLESLIKFIYNNIQYVKFNKKLDYQN